MDSYKLLLFIFLSWAHPLFAQDIAETFYLSPRESLRLTSSAHETISVEKKGIFKLHDRQQTLIISGQKIGRSQLRVGKRNFLIVVLPEAIRRSQKALQNWIENKRGPYLEISANKVFLKGRILTLADFQSLQQLSSQNVDFENRARLSANIQESTQQWLNKWLKEQNLHASAIYRGHNWQVSVQEKNPEVIKKYKRALSPFGIEVKHDPQQLTQKPVVEIKVVIAHLKTHFLRQWGLQWPNQVGAQIGNGPLSISTANLLVSLQALEGSGQGQLLAEPTLVTESGNQALFHSGGEFPMRTTTQFNSNVQWKQYGLFLKALPSVNAQEHLHIDLEIELSALDHNQTQEGIPALMRSQIKTQFNMEKLHPIVVSGFLKQERARGQSGLPWLQQIPILQPLFSSGQIQNDQLDLVFILIPSLRS